MLYNHHKQDFTIKSNNINYEYFDAILSAQHFHLSHDNFFEIIAVKCEANRLSEFSDKLIGNKRIIQGNLVMSLTK